MIMTSMPMEFAEAYDQMRQDDFMTDDAPETYRFRDLPLTPNMIAGLAREVMGDRLVKRSDLVNRVQELHMSRGGAESPVDLTASTKKALQVLQKMGKVENPGYGRWRWIDAPLVSDDETIEDVIEDEPDEAEFAVGVIIEGTGTGSVYVYHFPTYRELAETRNEDRWPIKIGMTSLGDAKVRIASQQGTAMPEAPVVSYIYRTDTPRKLERLIHSVLYYRGLQLDEAPGSEWFSANPSEVQAIVHFAMGEHDKTSGANIVTPDTGIYPDPS